MAMPDLPAAYAGELITRWLDGWTAARGYRSSRDDQRSAVVHVGDAFREVEYVVLSDSPADHHALLHRVVPGQWLTAPTRDRAGAERRVREAGRHVRAPEWLMMRALADHPGADVPAGYDVVSTVTARGVVVVEVVAAGELAAKGQLAVVGDDAVADRIFTMPTHRRRGLGTLVMATLTAAARDRGAHTGLLVASANGRALYTRLGWQVVADIVTAEIPDEASSGTDVGVPGSDPLE